MNIKINAHMAYTQKLDPKIIMANNILQMSSIELKHTLIKEYEENPALELKENIPEKICPLCNLKYEEKICPACGKIELNKLINENYDNIINQDDAAEESEYIIKKTTDKLDNGGIILEKISYKQPLSEYLSINLPLILKEKESYTIGRYLINYIDNNGYLYYDENEIIDKFNISKEKLEIIIKGIQSLEPPGIGARDLKECIIIQLNNLKGTIPKIVWDLLSDKYWNDYIHRRFTAISESMKISIDKIRKASNFIKDHVNPFPGKNFSNQISENQTARLIPDVIIKKTESGIDVYVEDKDYKKFRLSKIYKQLYQDIKKNKYKYTEKEIDHVNKYFFRAKIFLDNIDNRNLTILKVTKKIVEIQNDFFYQGIAYLKPLKKNILAKKLNIHNSTVSRATNNKLVELPCGKIVTFELFFDSSLPLKEKINKIIEQEYKNQPLSDNDIVKILNKNGIYLARRTIAKYREEMNMLSSRDRKYI